MNIKSILTGVALMAAALQTSAQSKHTFALGDSTFVLDGKPFQMISGEMHCARIPKEYWRDRMKMAKAMGLNTVGTYIFWNAHEEKQGKYDFSGNNNIAEFVKTAQQEGMWVVLRPSPYACAEWEFGGYPSWLLKDSTLKVRSKDPRFIDAYKKYIAQLAKQLVPLQITHGGNILMLQIENEYGSYSDDKSYMDLNRKIFREAGFDGILFTCDGADQMPKGYLPGYLPAVNGLDDPAAVKQLINKYHNNKGPYYIAEWYPGWFDHWGEKHAHTDATADAAKLEKILAAGISINMYMFHGGTTRGFMNGANMNRTEPYAPQVSSYDYDAPLDESGNPTEKFIKFREVIAKHLPAGKQLPPIPAKKAVMAINDIKLTAYSSVFDNLPKPVEAKQTMTFEALDQAYGFLLYRTLISKGGLLKLDALRDYAQVYINGKKIVVLDRRLKQDSVLLENIPANAVLDILTENNGRINYGPYLTDNTHGITKQVTLAGEVVNNWKMYRLPFESLAGFKFSAKNISNDLPALYKGTFTLNIVADTYLDMRQFGKGFVFLNGHNLGKYWNIGPQQTIYIPSVWLKKGKNEICVFDQLKNGHTTINSLEAPILDQNPATK
ncbi:beta-galactosidase [Mucilaginibacter sp. JRF]|nr:beta-galactosidase [Mucilaginibacter sp. JRF]